MLVIDLFIIAILMIILERIILKEKFILFSPYTLAHFAIVYIYILPFLFYGDPNVFNYVSRLDNLQVNNFLMFFRAFYYLFCFLSLFSLIIIKRRVVKKNLLMFKLSNTFMFISIIILISIILAAELIIVNFSISTFLDKMINPRRYTYLREGLGIFNHAVTFSKLTLLYITILYMKQKKGFVPLILLSIAVLINVLGGSKASLLFVLIFTIIIFQKSSFKVKKINLTKLSVTAALLFVLAIFSFMLMSETNPDRRTFAGAVEGIVGYSQEAYYSANVINDFNWKSDHISTVVEGLIFTPIPRMIFTNKDYYGLYNNYWRPYYQPNTVIYHTSTYGFLAEGFMLFSYITPLLYAILINWLLLFLYLKFYSVRGFSSFFIICYLIARIYFILRTGLFMPTVIWVLIIYFIASKIFFMIGNILNIKSTEKNVDMLKSFKTY